MYLQVLKNIMVSRNLRRADLARMAGVSRAAVSKWFHGQKGLANVESKTILKLASALHVSPDVFLKKRPDLSILETRFLWDHLYPNMESFVQALVRGQLPAIARLVQELGFWQSFRVLGKRVIVLFDRYKKYMKPARQKQLEVLWPLYRS